MEIVFLPKANEDLDFWKKSGNTIIQKNIHSKTILHLKVLENQRR